MKEVVKKVIPTNVLISTKECPDIDLSYRRCGNTTRLVNFAIQKLFEGYKVKIEEPGKKYSELKERLDMHLMYRIIDRLTHEHNLNYLLDREYIIINYKEMFISFIKEF